jgi:ParB family chromosome partitioning protein
MADSKQTKVTTKLTKELKDHPRQAALFGEVSEAHLAQLAADMEAHGLQHPVEILPDGTIVGGHQRVRAAKRLGWKEIDVVVLADLAEAGDAAVEEYLVRDNLIRRQLTPLKIAQGVQVLMEHHYKVRPGGLHWERKEELLVEIGRLIGKSGRTVSRYLLILKTPPAVQAAFDRNDLRLEIAGKVALLDAWDQKEVARRIEAGEPAKRVVAEALVPKHPVPVRVDRPFRRLAGALGRELPHLKGRAEEIDRDELRASVATLKDASAVLAELIKQAGGKAG